MHFAVCFWLWIHGLMLHEYYDTTTLKQHRGLSINETRSWGTSALVTSTLLRIAQQIVTFLSRTKSPLFPAWLSLTVCENSLIHNVTCMFQQILTKRVKCHGSRFEFFQSQFVYYMAAKWLQNSSAACEYLLVIRLICVSCIWWHEEFSACYNNAKYLKLLLILCCIMITSRGGSSCRGAAETSLRYLHFSRCFCCCTTTVVLQLRKKGADRAIPRFRRK